ncbi:MAG TPA: nuclear transport factor 2 family protein [Solirubrobacteraceae bacterium]
MSAPAAVAEIYEAFGRGDVEPILARVAQDVEWDVFADPASRDGVPWLVPRRDPAGVGEFFAAVGGGFEIHDFQVRKIFGDDRTAAAEVFIDATVRATGTRFADEELHVWEFGEDGKVVRFRHYTDTHKHRAAAGA